MKTKLLGAVLTLLLATLPLASFAGGVGGGNANSNWTIYGWQNWSLAYQTHDTTSITGDGFRERSTIRAQNEAANIGFAASIDTGVSVGGTAVKANFQCEQFTFFNRNSEFTHNSWCTRNSKLGLSGPWGEVMISAWLTPYNEMTAQWIDPFYDAGAHTHSTLLGLVGFGTAYGNGAFDSTVALGTTGLGNQGFMRRKPELWQWWSPNWGGLQLRVGWSNANIFSGDETETTSLIGPEELDPSILSIGAAYTHNFGNDELWIGLGYQQHDEWAAVDFGCSDSDDSTIRYAGRYIHDWGNGHSTRLSLAYEEMEYDWEDCAGGRAGATGVAAGPFNFTANATGAVDLERDAWLISGKHDIPGPLDFRFMYSDADDFECGGATVNATGDCNSISESSSGADAYSLGLFYTMPAGTELRLVYGQVDNDANSANGFGINSEGVVAGGEEEQWQIGVVQWF